MKETLIRMRTSVVILLGLATVLAMICVSATAEGFTCRRGGNECLNGNDIFDWGGNYGHPFNPIPNDSIAVSSFGEEAQVHFAGGGNGERRDQGIGWAGNFTRGDRLLWTNSPGQGPLTFTFLTPVLGVGANIQAGFQGPFTALIEAYDSDGNLLESFSEDGDSNGNGDGSAIFIGIRPFLEIKSVTFSLTDATGDLNDFAINQMDIIFPPGDEIPEPATLFLLGGGFLALAGTDCKQKRRC